jgi:patatin-like phospholipase/acyl hydrolase
MILANIEKHLDAISGAKIPLGLRFDLIAGTSTGGIIGLASNWQKGRRN